MFYVSIFLIYIYIYCVILLFLTFSCLYKKQMLLSIWWIVNNSNSGNTMELVYNKSTYIAQSLNMTFFQGLSFKFHEPCS